MKTLKYIGYIALLLECAYGASSLFAGPSAHAANGVMTGSGTIGNAYQIEDCTDLQFVGSGSYALTGSYEIANDIDCSATNITSPANSGSLWDGDAQGFLPIGLGEAFSGSINGLGNEIQNLYINRPAQNNIGIFSNIALSGTIGNLTISDAQVVGGNNVGTLAGKINFASGALGADINSILVTYSTVNGNNNIAGLAGEIVAEGGETIEMEYIVIDNVSVTASGSAAGLVAHFASGSVSQSTISGNISSINGDAGGFAAQANAATFENTYARGQVSGAGNVGGMIGYAEDTTLQSGYFYGDIINPQTATAGGIVGVYTGSTGYMEYMYAAATLSGTGNTGWISGQENSMLYNANTYEQRGQCDVCNATGAVEEVPAGEEIVQEENFYFGSGSNGGWAFPVTWQYVLGQNNELPVLSWMNLPEVDTLPPTLEVSTALSGAIIDHSAFTLFTGSISDRFDVAMDAMQGAIVSGSGFHWDESQQSFTGNTAYDLSVFHEAISGSGTENWSAAVPVVTQSGPMTIELVVQDTAGNEAQTSFPVIINSTGTVSIVSPLSGFTSQTSAIEFCANLNDVDGQGIYAEFDLLGVPTFTGNIVAGSGTSCAFETPSQEGSYEWSAKSCDEFGCSGEVSSTIIIDDQSPVTNADTVSNNYIKILNEDLTKVIINGTQKIDTFSGTSIDNLSLSGLTVFIQNTTTGASNESEYITGSGYTASQEALYSFAIGSGTNENWMLPSIPWPAFEGSDSFEMTIITSDIVGNTGSTVLDIYADHEPSLIVNNRYASGDSIDTLTPVIDLEFSDIDSQTGSIEIRVSSGSQLDCFNSTSIVFDGGIAETQDIEGVQARQIAVPALENQTTYNWCARAYDQNFAGEYVSGQFTTNQVDPQLTELAITATGSYITGQTLDLVARFSEAIEFAGSGSFVVELNVGGPITLTGTLAADTLTGQITIPSLTGGVVDVAYVSGYVVGAPMVDTWANELTLPEVLPSSVTNLSVCQSLTTYYYDDDEDQYPDQLATEDVCEGRQTDVLYIANEYGFDEDDQTNQVLNSCTVQSDCDNGPYLAVCDNNAGVCIPHCTLPVMNCESYVSSTSQVADTPYCKAETGFCVECLAVNHCEPGWMCNKEFKNECYDVTSAATIMTAQAARQSVLAAAALRPAATTKEIEGLEIELNDKERPEILIAEEKKTENYCPFTVRQNTALTTITDLNINNPKFDIAWSASVKGEYEVELDRMGVTETLDKGVYIGGDQITKVDLTEKLHFNYALSSKELMEKFGQSDENYDLNNDGIVDIKDYSLFYEKWQADSNDFIVRVNLTNKKCTKSLEFEVRPELFVPELQIAPRGSEITDAVKVMISGAENIYYSINGETDFTRYTEQFIVYPGETIYYYARLQDGTKTPVLKESYPRKVTITTRVKKMLQIKEVTRQKLQELEEGDKVTSNDLTGFVDTLGDVVGYLRAFLTQ